MNQKKHILHVCECVWQCVCACVTQSSDASQTGEKAPNCIMNVVRRS